MLAADGCVTVPGVGDPLSARIAHVELGFPVLFVSGFYATASLLGLPDADMLGFAEMAAHVARIRLAVPNALLIVDGDTGYGGPVQVKRTIKGFANSGAACVMIEDQVAPKQCGHTEGKQVVPFGDACARVQAAVDARSEMGARGPLVLARTDARIMGQAEAIKRGKAFKEMGADVVFLEAPLSEDDMRADSEALPGVHKMVNLVEWSKTPQLRKEKVAEMGYKIAVYPLLMLNASIGAMYQWCRRLRDGEGDNDQQVAPVAPEECTSTPALMANKDVHRLVGFPDYHRECKRYADVHARVVAGECADADAAPSKRVRT